MKTLNYFATTIIVTLYTSAAPAQTYPNLHQLLAGVKDCDVQIIHNVQFPSKLQHFYFLPSTIYYINSTKKYTRYKPLWFIDITKTRPLFCRLIYIILEPKSGSLGVRQRGLAIQASTLFELFFHNPLSTDRSDRMRMEIRSYNNRYFISTVMYNPKYPFSKDSGHWLKHGLLKKGFEYLGEIALANDSIHLCIGVKSFQLLPKNADLPCFQVNRSNNILEILQKERTPPAVWRTWMALPGDTDAFFKIKYLTSIPPARNPFDILGMTPLSRALYMILVVYFKSNSTLEYTPHLSIPSNVNPLTGKNLQNYYSDAMIYTDLSGYKFLTCYSESRITFEFYLTPFQPEI